MEEEEDLHAYYSKTHTSAVPARRRSSRAINDSKSLQRVSPLCIHARASPPSIPFHSMPRHSILCFDYYLFRRESALPAHIASRYIPSRHLCLRGSSERIYTREKRATLRRINLLYNNYFTIVDQWQKNDRQYGKLANMLC